MGGRGHEDGVGVASWPMIAAAGRVASRYRYWIATVCSSSALVATGHASAEDIRQGAGHHMCVLRGDSEEIDVLLWASCVSMMSVCA